MSMRPGITVLPAASKVRAPAGTVTVPLGPTAAMRFPVTTTSAFSSTSLPFMVTTRAPFRTKEPLGWGRGRVRATVKVWALGSFSSSSSSAPFLSAPAFFLSSFLSPPPAAAAFFSSSALRRCSSANLIASSSGSR